MGLVVATILGIIMELGYRKHSTFEKNLINRFKNTQELFACENNIIWGDNIFRKTKVQIGWEI